MDSNQIHINLAKIKSGDRPSQKKLYDAYRVYLFGVANLYSNSREEAEDILLEGFYRIFKDIGAYDGSGDLRAWMRRVMVNSALMHLRKYRSWTQKVSFGQDEKMINVPDQIDFTAAQRVDSIMIMVRALPEPQRIIFTLKGIEGYSYREISEKLGIKEPTLRSHYLRARNQLQIVLQKELK